MSKVSYGAVPVVEGVGVQEPSVYRRGKSFFGCCDIRRAVIIVDIIDLVLLGVQLILYSMAMGMNIQDPEYAKTMNGEIPYMIGICIIEMSLLGIAICGAMRFSSIMVFAGVLVYAIGALVSIRIGSLGGLVLNALFGFPHVFLCLEINNYIMSQETYQHERHSCCCI